MVSDFFGFDAPTDVSVFDVESFDVESFDVDDSDGAAFDSPLASGFDSDFFVAVLRLSVL